MLELVPRSMPPFVWVKVVFARYLFQNLWYQKSVLAVLVSFASNMVQELLDVDVMQTVASVFMSVRILFCINFLEQDVA